MKETARILKALGEETRLRIYGLLSAKGELCVCDITATLGITQTHASRSLGVLKGAGLVNDRRDGLWMHYSVVKGENYGEINALIEGLIRSDETLENDLKKAKIVMKKSAGCCRKYCKKEK